MVPTMTTSVNSDKDARVRTCPRCDSTQYIDYGSPKSLMKMALNIGILPPALSRFDNATYICSPCGTEEAMQDFMRVPLNGPRDWPLLP